jgi:hypothetical protein
MFVAFDEIQPSEVRALCALFLHSFVACPTTAHSFMLLLLGLVAFLG